MLKNLTYILIIASNLIVLSSCTKNLSNLYQNNKIEVYRMDNLENFKAIDSYSLFQKNGDLVFSIELKNNTGSTIHLDTDVRPFSIYHNDEQRLDAKPYPSFTTTVPKKIIDIKAGGSYTLDYILNKEYLFMDGTNDYQLVYIEHFYDVDTKKKVDPKFIKTINFTWEKLKDSNRGILISKDQYEQ